MEMLVRLHGSMIVGELHVLGGNNQASNSPRTKEQVVVVGEGEQNPP